jgi:hypothetical protein
MCSEIPSESRQTGVCALKKEKSRPSRWARIIFPATGLFALFWFICRVLPKPSRAAYPCQQAAAPVASLFVVWLMTVIGSSLAYRHAKKLLGRKRWQAAAACFGLALAGGLAAVVTAPETFVRANPAPEHGPIGEGRGIHPGRVVWVHAPEATDWAGYESAQHWWNAEHTDLAVVEEMMSQALLRLAGKQDGPQAWQALFTHFNQEKGRGQRGYSAGEKIAIKINLTTCNARGREVDLVTYQKKPNILNRVDTSPQMVLALLRQLVYVAGAKQEDITVGDPTGLFPSFMWDMIYPEFPGVRYLDNHGGSGRTRAEFSKTPFYWSTPAAQGKRQDYIPVPFAEADYIINFAVLKGHSAGITVCAKNDYGSLLRCPDGFLRDEGTQNFYDLHRSIPGGAEGNGMGRYRALVDMMGHPHLGGKTMLFLIDGLYGGYYWEGIPRKWTSAPFGDGTRGDWPSSLFASQDPVAIDSVAYDFLLEEWPRVVTGGTGAAGSLRGGAEDYLHEAALAGAPPSGTFYDPSRDGVGLKSLGVHEHWNNPVEKKYSRNLGYDRGIELVALHVSQPEPTLQIERRGPETILSWQGSLPGYRLQVATDLSRPISWQTVDRLPALFQGRNVITNQAAGSKQFFRLIGED